MGDLCSRLTPYFDSSPSGPRTLESTSVRPAEFPSGRSRRFLAHACPASTIACKQFHCNSVQAYFLEKWREPNSVDLAKVGQLYDIDPPLTGLDFGDK